jgi:GT2 family glycosyltransferase
MTLEILHHFQFPRIDLCQDAGLYFHANGPAHHVLTEPGLLFWRGGEATFDTYFNSFSTGKWKRHTTLASLLFRVRLSGRFILRLCENRPNAAPRVVREVVVESTDLAWQEVDLPYETLSPATLFLRVVCLSEAGSLTEAYFATRTSPRLQPRVGVVITTFNRPAYVLKTLGRLRERLAEDVELSRQLHVVVVDNAANLHLSSTDSVTYLPSVNVGGSGGFARGLLHLRNRGGFTHVLFMDDDVTFDVESIRRAIAFCAYALDPDTCVSGAMFVEAYPNVQYEAGGRLLFDQREHYQRFGADRDMRDWRTVMLNDAADEPIGCSGWFFFLFPIGLSGEDLPFPFFIRGDDALFSYKYAGKIVTLNGINVWHTAFDYKDSATREYYTERNFAVVRALLSPGTSGVWPTLSGLTHGMLSENLAYRYRSAEYRLRAIRDFLRGPKFWEDTDLATLHRELRSNDDETLGSLGFDIRAATVEYDASTRQAGLLGRAARNMTLNGHLLPRWLIRRIQSTPMRAVDVQTRAPAATFCQERVLCWYPPTGEGFVVEHSKRKFFTNLARLLVLSIRLMGRYRAVREAYIEAYPAMVKPQYWERYFESATEEKGDVRSARSVERVPAGLTIRSASPDQRTA